MINNFIGWICIEINYFLKFNYLFFNQCLLISLKKLRKFIFLLIIKNSRGGNVRLKMFILYVGGKYQKLIGKKHSGVNYTLIDSIVCSRFVQCLYSVVFSDG